MAIDLAARPPPTLFDTRRQAGARVGTGCQGLQPIGMTHPVRHTAFTFVLAFLAFLFAPGFNRSVHAQQQPAVTVTLTGPTEVNQDTGTWNYWLAATTEGATAPTVDLTVSFYELPAAVTGHTAGSGDYTGPGDGGRRFVFAPSDFSIPSGETNQTATKTGTVTIIDDTDEEDDETFHIFLNGYYPNMMPDTVTVSNPASVESVRRHDQGQRRPDGAGQRTISHLQGDIRRQVDHQRHLRRRSIRCAFLSLDRRPTQ